MVKKTYQEGQTLLIVVLILVVFLTIGLAVASRSLTNLRTSIEEQNSQQAFSAAEAGIEQALKSSNSGKIAQDQTLDATGGTTIKEIMITPIKDTEFLLKGGSALSKDDGSDVWLVAHDTNGLLDYNGTDSWQAASFTGTNYVTFYWGTAGDICLSDSSNSMAALEIIAITGTSTLQNTTRYAVDPCTTGRRDANQFTTTSQAINSVVGKQFAYKTTILIAQASKGILLRVVPVYANTVVGVRACDHRNPIYDASSCKPLPLQGRKIDSIGSSGGTSRKITVFQGYPELSSEFFHYSFFSP